VLQASIPAKEKPPATSLPQAVLVVSNLDKKGDPEVAFSIVRS
jgi:hypothetical protein